MDSDIISIIRLLGGLALIAGLSIVLSTGSSIAHDFDMRVFWGVLSIATGIVVIAIAISEKGDW